MVDYMGDFVEQRADDEQQETEEPETPNGDEEEAQNGDEDEANDGEDEHEEAEENHEEKEAIDHEGEMASSDDDVVTGLIEAVEEDGPEAAVNEDGIYEECPKVDEQEERNEPSTGDSGVDDPTQDEEQVLS